MGRVTQWMVAIGVVTGMVAGTPNSSAQPDVRDHRGAKAPPPAAPPPADRDHGRGHEHDRKRPPPATEPTEAPPAPQAETATSRAGFVWIPGRWDWRGKWEWVAGHAERERAGKNWREGHWDHQGDKWVYSDGAWAEVGTASPPLIPPDRLPPQPMPPDRHDPERHDRRREWKLDRPTVSSYWPVKGKVGSRIVIRGKNFASDTAVLWAGTQVNGAKVTPEEIVVAVPPGAASGTIALRTGRGRDLSVGNYEVADYDAAAEAKRLADEARKKAEQDWADRQKLLAKDRAARTAAAEQHRQERAQTREQRREDRLKELRAKWEAAFLADPDTQAELTLHAQRGAEIDRMREVAELSENGKLVIRIGVAQSREDERHQARMSALHDSLGRKP
jgi:hypothetical protein